MKLLKMARYSELYAEGQAVLRKYNPCKVENGKCAAGDFCCQGCKHLGPEGCTVDSLMCKLWLCHYVVRNSEAGSRAYQELVALDRQRCAEGIPALFRGSKEESFEHY